MTTKEKFTKQQSFQLLLSRLDWPSGLVREKTCTELAFLLSEPTSANLAKEFILKWIGDQTLESTQALGLLVFIYARDHYSNVPMPTERELIEKITFPCLLSWLLFKEIHPEATTKLEAFLSYKEIDDDIKIEIDFFHKYKTAYLPGIYNYRANRIDHGGKSFTSQWAFEWQVILNRLEKQPTAHEGDHWFRPLPNKERYTIIDTEMSEVYRSAYLRTLAWLVSNKVFSTDLGLFFAAETCPVDLELWKLTPQSCPAWWPISRETSSIVDTTMGNIWKDIAKLWEDKIIDHHDNSWIISQAQGTVRNGDMYYEIVINGLFQKCLGPVEPDYEEISDWCNGAENDVNILKFEPISPLHFSGMISSRNPDEMVKRIEDWDILAASNHHFLFSRWQPWRDKIHLPSPIISDPSKSLSFAVEEQEITIKEGEKAIGRYFDWTYSIRETSLRHVDIPYQAGQVLLLSQEAIDRFCLKTNTTFCWLTTINVHYKEDTYRDEYKRFSLHQVLGASKIVRP